jgi:hypothetical protein
MDLTLRRWRPRHLLLAWSAYWAALAAVALAPALKALARLTGPGEHGTASASFADGVLQVTIASPSAPAWTGGVAVGTLALWVAIPPLLLWLLWLARRPSRGPVATTPLSQRETALGAAGAPPLALPDADLQPPMMGARGSAQPAQPPSSPRPSREPSAQRREP